jgi:hypothetical protein
MKLFFITIIAITASFAQAPFGVFSSLESYKSGVPDVLDSSFVISEISQSADPNDKDFCLEYKDERGRVKLYRKSTVVFADGKDYFIVDGTHGFGAPRFRKLTRCDSFSYFRRVYSAPAGTLGHSDKGINESWVIFDETIGELFELTDKTLKQILIRKQPLLYNEYTDRGKRNGRPIDYIKMICQ